MNITIDKINHYCYDDKDLFDILKDSVMLMYERISKSDDECNKVYNIIDILWSMKLQS